MKILRESFETSPKWIGLCPVCGAIIQYDDFNELQENDMIHRYIHNIDVIPVIDGDSYVRDEYGPCHGLVRYYPEGTNGYKEIMSLIKDNKE